MPKYNKKVKRKSDDTMDPLYDLDKMSDREVVWPSPKTPEVSSVVQFIIDNTAPGRTYSSGNHPNVLLPTGYIRDEEVLSRDSGSEGDYTVLGVSPSITPSLACEVLITENSQQNGDKSKQVASNNTNDTSVAQQQNCLREIDLSMNHNSRHHLNGEQQLLKSDNELTADEVKEEIIDYEDQDPDEDDLDLSEAELNVDETEAMKQLGYCIHRITYFKLYNEQMDTVKCSACDEVIGKTVRETSTVVKLEFTCNYCDLTFDLIGDLNMHLINHYHEIETGRPVLYET